MRSAASSLSSARARAASPEEYITHAAITPAARRMLTAAQDAQKPRPRPTRAPPLEGGSIRVDSVSPLSDPGLSANASGGLQCGANARKPLVGGRGRRGSRARASPLAAHVSRRNPNQPRLDSVQAHDRASDRDGKSETSRPGASRVERRGRPPSRGSTGDENGRSPPDVCRSVRGRRRGRRCRGPHGRERRPPSEFDSREACGPKRPYRCCRAPRRRGRSCVARPAPPASPRLRHERSGRSRRVP